VVLPLRTRPQTDRVAALCQSADAAARRNEITAAVLDFNRGIATAPRDPRPYIGLAVLYEGLDRPDLAIEALQQLRAANPEAEHLGCRLAEAHLGVEDTRRARELGEQAVKREPNCARAFTNYGLALARMRFYDSSSAALRRARELAPKDHEIGEALVDVYLQQGAFSSAARLGEELIAAGAGGSKLEYNVGLAYSRLPPGSGGIEQGIRHLTRASELEPSWFAPHAEIGRIQRSMGRTREALAAFERAWKLNPNVSGVAFNLVSLLRQTGSPRAAELERRIPRLSKSSRRLSGLRGRYFQQPADLPNTLALASLEAESGMPAVALHRLRKLLSADPANRAALEAYLRIDRAARARYPEYLKPGPGYTAL
jgi:tetratricopeptide (TPR) repeat protein